VLVLLEGDDDIGGEEVLLADLGAGGGSVAEIDLTEAKVLLGLRGEDELRREEVNGEAAGEGLPGKVEDLGLMIEDRLGEAAAIVITRTDEQNPTLHILSVLCTLRALGFLGRDCATG
jgi:hypothetical protein